MNKIDEIASIHKIKGILRMNLPSEGKEANKFGKIFSAQSLIESLHKNKKRIITISLTGDKSKDEKRFDLIRSEARRIKYTGDTTDILKVHFCSENTYDDFVRMVNIMEEDRHNRYTFYQDDFYVLSDNE